MFLKNQFAIYLKIVFGEFCEFYKLLRALGR